MRWLFTLIGMVLLVPRAHSEAYPSRQVKLIVPFPAGSATDQVARLTGSQLQGALHQPFIVENKPGAQDFAPVAGLGTTSFMLMVRPDFPARDLKEFLSHVKKQPGKLSAGYGSSGSQVSLAMLKSMGRLDVVEVPYKGIPQAITDTMGGSLAFTFVDLGNALAQAKGGKLRGLAVTSAKRTPLAPDVPALAEELPGYELIAWFGLVAPAKTPNEVVRKLHDATVRGLAKSEVKEKFAAIGTDVAPLNPAEFARFIQAEIAHWATLVKLAGIEPE